MTHPGAFGPTHGPPWFARVEVDGDFGSRTRGATITPLTRSDPDTGYATMAAYADDASASNGRGEALGATTTASCCGPPGRVLRGSGLDSGWALAPLSAVTRGENSSSSLKAQMDKFRRFRSPAWKMATVLTKVD